MRFSLVADQPRDPCLAFLVDEVPEDSRTNLFIGNRNARGTYKAKDLEGNAFIYYVKYESIPNGVLSWIARIRDIPDRKRLI